MQIDFLKALRCCPTCSSLLKNSDFLCAHCKNILVKRIKLNKINIGVPNLEVYSLLIWNREDPFLVRLIYSLKQGHNKIGFKILSESFLQLGLAFKNKTFVPIPSSLPGKKDHALEFSRQLSTKFKGRVLNNLKQKQGPGQKAKSRLERQSVSFSMIQRAGSGAEIVLVDDVVTTGSSLKAGFKLYEKNSKITALTVAYRPNFEQN